MEAIRMMMMMMMTKAKSETYSLNIHYTIGNGNLFNSVEIICKFSSLH